MIKKLIFLTEAGVSRAAMASYIANDKAKSLGYNLVSVPRGYVVLFPEPMNQKTASILASKGFEIEGYQSVELTEDEISDDCLIFTMSEKQQVAVINKYDGANEGNTFVLSKYVGDELEIIDPYGDDITKYGLCFEVINATLDKLFALLKEAEEIS